MASRLLPMYNIDKAVGQSRPNLADDVRLIQTLFETLSKNADPIMEGCTPVPVTGSYTPQLGALITKYQTNLRGGKFQFVVDGVIDPLPANSKVGEDWNTKFGGGATSTLVAMNYRLFRINKSAYLGIGDRLNLAWKPDPFKIT